ncbi:hypothetical protein K5I29_03905 [Flavobacterium agricola]|uniref:Outer membrane protein beta-barrel domain-containing protein n=1 Tax=Flavobacterium agricola TaxID=2870839 RepID=A0ABY6M1D4_9FLAO|nr:hypothetical protein [Flavobacterium agricola]UYW02057.1 hypothetical protein K5I29_03905 [Flavobacterium agricola]
MKRCLLTFVCLISITAFAQHILPEKLFKKKKENYDLFREVNYVPHPHEIKFDLLSLAINQKIQFSYEYQSRLQWYFGMSINFHQNKSRKNSFETDKYFNLPQYEIIPYARYALTKDQVKFVFIEGFLAINGGKHKTLDALVNNGSYVYTIKQSNYLDIAPGLSLGFKTRIKKRFSVEVLGGSSVNLFNEKSPKYVPRYALNVGYFF